MADLSNNSKGEGAATGVDAIRDAVEGSKNPDESNKDDDTDDDDSDDDSSDDDSSGDDAAGDDSDDADDDSDDDADDSDDDGDDDAESGDKKDPKSGRKFSQFAGDGTDKAYISNLEEGYRNSSAEAIRINDELKTANGRVDAVMRAVAGNPELSKALNDAVNGAGGSGDGGSDGDENSQVPGADNPFIRNLQSEWQEKSQAEIQEFIDANPEVVTDPKISADVKHYMKIFSNDHFERTGKLMSGGEAMAKAFKHLDLEDKRGKQDLANGAKKNLTPPRSRGNKAKKSGGQKPKFTDAQVAMAVSMGKDQAWLEKNAT
jgi:hypothetical protein